MPYNKHYRANKDTEDLELVISNHKWLISKLTREKLQARTVEELERINAELIWAYQVKEDAEKKLCD